MISTILDPTRRLTIRTRTTTPPITRLFAIVALGGAIREAVRGRLFVALVRWSLDIMYDVCQRFHSILHICQMFT